MDCWSRTHVSDHAGFHYRQALIARAYELMRRGGEDDGVLLPVQQVPHASSLLGFLFRDATLQQLCALMGGACQASLLAVAALVKRELDFCTALLLRYPGHEAVWCHRRFAYACWIRTVLPAAGQVGCVDGQLVDFPYEWCRYSAALETPAAADILSDLDEDEQEEAGVRHWPSREQELAFASVGHPAKQQNKQASDDYSGGFVPLLE